MTLGRRDAETRTHAIEKAPYHKVHYVWAVDLRNRVSEWELRLTIASQHYEGISYLATLARERGTFTIRGTVFSECVSITHHHNVKKSVNYRVIDLLI